MSARPGLIACALALLVGAVGGQVPGDGGIDLERQRARWETLAPEEQARLRERYERFQHMSREERERIVARAERLRGIAEQAHRRLTPELRAELEGLAPERRRERLRELVAAETRDVGRRILGWLPADVRRRLDDVDPAERERILAELQAGRMERLEQLARRLGLDEQELERARALPPVDRRRHLLELLREHIELRIEETGLPPGFPLERWEELEVVSPEEFFAGFMRLRQSDPRLGRAVFGRDAHPPPGNPPRPAGAGDASRERLRAALGGDPADRVGLSGLAARERARELLRRRRERALEVIRTEGLLTPERQAELERAPLPRFFRIARMLAGGPGSGWSRAEGAERASDGRRGPWPDDRDGDR